jgi:hypothetical protein
LISLFKRFYWTLLKYQSEWLVPVGAHRPHRSNNIFLYLPLMVNRYTLNMTNPPTFPVSYSPAFLRPLDSRFITVLRNYLKIVYLFTYSDFGTTLIPVVRASFLPSFVARLPKSCVHRRPPSPTFLPPIQAHIVLCMRYSGRGYISFNSVSRTSVWMLKRTH